MNEDSNSIADDLLRNGYERWERLEGEKAAIGEDLKELFAELKGHGFTPKALRESFRRVSNMADAAQQEHDAIVDLYVSSLTGARPAPARVENIDEFPAEEDAPDEVQARISALKINSPSQPAPQAGSDLTNPPPSSGQVAPHPVAKASEDDGATEQDIEVPADSVTGDASRASVSAGSDALIPLAYPEPGEVYWENTPRQPAHRHEYSAAFGDLGQDPHVINDDITRAMSAPIVMIGEVILDGWARYNCARCTKGIDGQTTHYPAVQYAGTDPLIDCIRLNIEGRMLTESEKRQVVQRLVRIEPKRKADIFKAMDMGMELVA